MAFSFVRGGLVCDATPAQRPSEPATADAKFHFALSSSPDGRYIYVGDGAVQIGGYTSFVSGSRVVDMPASPENRTGIVCVEVDLAFGDLPGTFRLYTDEEAVNAAQDDSGMFVSPLYKFDRGAVVLDYRPLPSLGSWEIAPVESQSEGE